MKREEAVERIRNMIRPIIDELGYEFYHIEFVTEDNENYLRIYIDTPEGISLDDCEKVSRPVSDLLDVEDPIPESYYLEVSSPGLNRTLYTDEHLGKYKGNEVLVKLKTPIDGKRSFKGTLNQYSDVEVIIICDGEEVHVPKSKVKTINLEGEL